MEIVNPHAAGIDIGSRSHWVAVGQSELDVRELGVFNQDLFALADWLDERKIRIVPWKVPVLIGKISMQFLSPGVFT